MQTTTIPPMISQPRRHGWGWIVLLILVALPTLFVALLWLSVASLFHLSSDTRAVRNALMQSSGTQWQPQVALHAGGPIWWVTRAGLSCLNLEPEARAALHSARSAEVSVSRVRTASRLPDHNVMLAKADTCMNRRGWDRVVGVKQNHQIVGVYVPRSCRSASHLQCCVVAFDGHELVVVSAKANLEPLIECLMEQPEFQEGFHELVRR